jgi:hypothetical protein
MLQGESETGIIRGAGMDYEFKLNAGVKADYEFIINEFGSIIKNMNPVPFTS